MAELYNESNINIDSRKSFTLNIAPRLAPKSNLLNTSHISPLIPTLSTDPLLFSPFIFNFTPHCPYNFCIYGLFFTPIRSAS